MPGEWKRAPNDSSLAWLETLWSEYRIQELYGDRKTKIDWVVKAEDSFKDKVSKLQENWGARELSMGFSD